MKPRRHSVSSSDSSSSDSSRDSRRSDSVSEPPSPPTPPPQPQPPKEKEKDKKKCDVDKKVKRVEDHLERKIYKVEDKLETQVAKKIHRAEDVIEDKLKHDLDRKIHRLEDELEKEVVEKIYDKIQYNLKRDGCLLVNGSDAFGYYYNKGAQVVPPGQALVLMNSDTVLNIDQKPMSGELYICRDGVYRIDLDVMFEQNGVIAMAVNNKTVDSTITAVYANTLANLQKIVPLKRGNVIKFWNYDLSGGSILNTPALMWNANNTTLSVYKLAPLTRKFGGPCKLPPTPHYNCEDSDSSSDSSSSSSDSDSSYERYKKHKKEKKDKKCKKDKNKKKCNKKDKKCSRYSTCSSKSSVASKSSSDYSDAN